jgi:hypothetical protein
LITRDQLALLAQAPFTSTTVGFVCVFVDTAAVDRPARATAAKAVAQIAVTMAPSFTFDRGTPVVFAAEMGLLGWVTSLFLPS